MDWRGLGLIALTALANEAAKRLDDRKKGGPAKKTMVASVVPPAPLASAAPAALPVPALPPSIDILKQQLRAALQLEFATIPPYLTALWSIIDQADPVAKSIRAVVHEEMLHLALLCNLLSALGERPVLTGSVVPCYPRQLPGGVLPGVTLDLLGYGSKALKIFMSVERPAQPLPIAGEPPEQPSTDITIGQFYDSVLRLFEALDPPLDFRHQLAGPFAWLVMGKSRDVSKALELIMAQGEGAHGRPYARYQKYPSHYYRFKQLALSRRLHWNDKTKEFRKGKPIVQPSVFTLAPARWEGYGLAAPPALRKASDRFEATYSEMLRLLEASWQDGGHKCFVRALERMFELGDLAQTMMRIGTPDGRGYCPSFRYHP